MVDAKPNTPYDGYIVNHFLLDNAKLYQADIRGRPDPTRCEWNHCGRSIEPTIEAIRKYLQLHNNSSEPPYVAISFPHATTLFRWGTPYNPKERETNLYKLGLGRTPDGRNMTFEAPSGLMEVGCPLELLVLGQEAEFWSSAGSVQEYLGLWVPNGQVISVINPNKLLK
jgi:hypothetical protein